MKHILKLTAAFLLLFSLSQNLGATSPDRAKSRFKAKKDTTYILAIGNSFSTDAIEQNLYELFKAAGQEVVIGNLYIGGCRLERHWKNMNEDLPHYSYRRIVSGEKVEYKKVTLETGLKDRKWDYVSFQQSSGISGQYETYEPYLSDLIKYVKEVVSNRNLKLMFHQTWAYSVSSNHRDFPKYDNDQLKMYNAIMSAVKEVMKNHPELSIVVPCGTAIQNARTSFMGNVFTRDGYHLEKSYGRYTAACTWYEAITGKSVIGNEYAPASISLQEKMIAQLAAHYANQHPWTITDLSAKSLN